MCTILHRQIGSVETHTTRCFPLDRIAPVRVLVRAVPLTQPGEPLSRKRWLLSPPRAHGPGKRQAPPFLPCVSRFRWGSKLTIRTCLQPKKTHAAQEQYVCVTCGRTDSPEWRKVRLSCSYPRNTCSDNCRWSSAFVCLLHRFPTARISVTRLSFVLLFDST